MVFVSFLLGFGLMAATSDAEPWAYPVGIGLIAIGALMLAAPLVRPVAVRVDATGIRLGRLLWNDLLRWDDVAGVGWESGSPTMGQNFQAPRLVVALAPPAPGRPLRHRGPAPSIPGIPPNATATQLSVISWTPDLQELLRAISAHAPGLPVRLGPYSTPIRPRSRRPPTGR